MSEEGRKNNGRTDKNIKMSPIQIRELYTIFKELAVSSCQKDLNVSDTEWLSRCYRERLSDLSEEEIQKLSAETLDGIERFNSALEDIKQSTASGTNKEAWFAAKVIESLDDEVNSSGEYLKDLDQAITYGNAQNIQLDTGVETSDIPDIHQVQKQEPTQENWDSFKVKEVALHLGKNAALVGLQSLADTQESETISTALEKESAIPDVRVKSLMIDNHDMPLKTAMTAALKIGVEKKIIPFIPEHTSVETLANIACMGIERVKILYQFATGRLNIGQALEHMGLASLVMICNICTRGAGDLARVALSWIPVVGPILGNIVGNMVTCAVDKTFREVIHNAAKKIESSARTAVSSIWNNIKATGKKISDKVKNFCSLLFS